VTEGISVSTKGHTDIIDITSKVQSVVKKSKVKGGVANVFVSGSTAGLTTVEFEPGLMSDLTEAFQRIAPEGPTYAHDSRWGDGNGYAHVRSSLLGCSLSIPIIEGELALGTWQQIVLIDFDNRARERQVIVQAFAE